MVSKYEEKQDERRYVCPHCRRRFASQRAIKQHIHKYLNRNPTCMVCGKRFRTTHQLCIHAYAKVYQRGDALHAVVYYLARKKAQYRKRTSANSILKLGDELAGDVLSNMPLLLTPPPEGEWQRTIWALARTYYLEKTPLDELAREVGVHPNELRRMFGEASVQ